MRRQAEQLVAVVRAQAVDEQRQINGHDRLAEEHAEARLVLLPRRRQEGDQGRHTCRQRTRSSPDRLQMTDYTLHVLSTELKHVGMYDDVISLFVCSPEAMEL